MVNENKIPIEVKKPFETVYELKNYEIKKSPLSPAARAKVIKKYGSDYVSERAFNNDIALTEMYGPGFWGDFWDDIKVVVKPVASGALVVASVFPPTAPIATTITLGVVGTGGAVMGLGHVTDNKELKAFGKDIVEIADHADNFQGKVAERGGKEVGQYYYSR